MVLDSSAVVAILLREPEATALAQAIERDPVRFVSAANWLETQLVLRGRSGLQGGLMVEAFFRELRVEIVPLDATQVHTALAAWNRYGKGRHPAALNLGDCCAYAAATLTNQKLLFKGADFSKTDINPVLY